MMPNQPSQYEMQQQIKRLAWNADKPDSWPAMDCTP